MHIRTLITWFQPRSSATTHSVGCKMLLMSAPRMVTPTPTHKHYWFPKRQEFILLRDAIVFHNIFSRHSCLIHNTSLGIVRADERTIGPESISANPLPPALPYPTSHLHLNRVTKAVKSKLAIVRRMLIKGKCTAVLPSCWYSSITSSYQSRSWWFDNVSILHVQAKTCLVTCLNAQVKLLQSIHVVRKILKGSFFSTCLYLIRDAHMPASY